MGMGVLGKGKQTVIVALAITTIAAGVTGVIASRVSDKQEDTKKVATSAPATVSTRPAVTATTVTYQGQDGKTALELLKQAAQVETKQSSMGEYVVSVNGNDGSGSKYWMFYVNGKEASVGAGAYITKSTDAIEWKLQ